MYVCHRGHYEGLSWCRLVGSCVLPEEISSHRPACKTTFARLTQSQAISQSFHFFITFRSMRDATFFSFSKLFFIQNYCFLYHGDQKISWRICRWRAVNFEIHMCSSGMNCDWIWRSISIKYVQIEHGVNSDLGNGSFQVGLKSVTLSM